MSAYKFKGWENIDGSSVTREETDSAFKVVMHSAREIEAAYQVRQKTVKRAKVMRIMMYAAAALILIASPLAIYHMMDHEETDLMATSSLTTDHGEIQEITLPDGSMVTLNSGSTLTWPDELLDSFCNDLLSAENKGWNLIMEKYARMMESTTPEKYEELKKDLPVLNEERIAIQEEIVKIQVGWMEEFAAKYPKMAGNARSIHTAEDTPFNTSYETYLRGELGTYSENTFILYGRFITGLLRENRNLAYETMENTAKLYGYESVEEAEERL